MNMKKYLSHIFEHLTCLQKTAFVLSVVLIWGMVIYLCLHPDDYNPKIIIPIILSAFLLMAYFILTFIYKIFQENLPYQYQEKRSFFGEPMAKFTLHCYKISHLPVRNINVCIEIYRDKIVISKFNRCLIINHPNQIEIKSSFLFCTIEFKVDNCKICCYIRKKQHTLIKDWMQI